MDVIGFFTERGKRKPITAKKRSLFAPRKYEYLSDIIRVDTPEGAKDSVKKLESEYRGASKAKKMRIIRAAAMASNIAGVMSRNPKLSRKQRAEAKKVQSIYLRWISEVKGD